MELGIWNKGGLCMTGGNDGVGQVDPAPVAIPWGASGSSGAPVGS